MTELALSSPLRFRRTKIVATLGPSSEDAEIVRQLIEAGVNVVELLVRSGLSASRSEARRLVLQGGAYLNDQPWSDVEQPVGINCASEGQIIVRAGKKRYHRFVVTDVS